MLEVAHDTDLVLIDMTTNFNANDAMVISVGANAQVILDFRTYKVMDVLRGEVKREIHFDDDSFSLQDYHNFVAEAAERAAL